MAVTSQTVPAAAVTAANAARNLPTSEDNIADSLPIVLREQNATPARTRGKPIPALFPGEQERNA
jgi:hypothetical protein